MESDARKYKNMLVDVKVIYIPMFKCIFIGIGFSKCFYVGRDILHLIHLNTYFLYRFVWPANSLMN